MQRYVWNIIYIYIYILYIYYIYIIYIYNYYLYIYTHIGGFPIYGGTPLSLDGDLSNPHLSVLLYDRGHRWNHPKLRILLGVGMY